MFNAIVQHTPVWVWALLIGLIALGLSQTRDREMSLTRVTILPLAMTALSLSGVFTAFGATPLALVSWAIGLVAAMRLGAPLVAARGARWSDTSARIQVPGSWRPMALIVGLFMLKYTVGVALALHPGLAADALVAAACSAAYGLFSGLLLARACALRGLTPRAAQLRPA